MKKRPQCAIEGCKRDAFVLFGSQWICGECLTKYDSMMKEKQFQELQEAIR